MDSEIMRNGEMKCFGGCVAPDECLMMPFFGGRPFGVMAVIQLITTTEQMVCLSVDPFFLSSPFFLHSGS